MKFSICLLISIFSLSLFSFVLSPPKWKRYTNNKGKFSAEFSSKPKDTKVSDKNGKTTYKSISQDGILTYAVLATDSEADLSQMKQIAQQTLDKFLVEGNEVVTKESFLVDEYYEGLKTKIKMNDKNNTHLFYQIVVAEDRLYQSMVITVNDFPREILANKFLDSFEIKE